MPLHPVATYRRRVGASLPRVWENVRDWEHLPWLHRESFRSVALEEQGAFGWRARVGLPGAAEVRLELVRDGELDYVVRTLAGPGTGSEIWTRLAPVDAAHTDVAVEFCLPDVAPAQRDALGGAYVALYTRLWDQDEAMMQRRSFLLAAPRRRAAPGPVELDLGPEAELRLPLRVELGGRPLAVVRDAGELVVFDALCPHALGPLDAGAVEQGRVVCPWHGYAYDIRSGRGCGEARRLQLFAPPRLERRAGRVVLVRESS